VPKATCNEKMIKNQSTNKFTLSILKERNKMPTKMIETIIYQVTFRKTVYALEPAVMSWANIFTKIIAEKDAVLTEMTTYLWYKKNSNPRKGSDNVIAIKCPISKCLSVSFSLFFSNKIKIAERNIIKSSPA